MPLTATPVSPTALTVTALSLPDAALEPSATLTPSATLQPDGDPIRALDGSASASTPLTATPLVIS